MLTLLGSIVAAIVVAARQYSTVGLLDTGTGYGVGIYARVAGLEFAGWWVGVGMGMLVGVGCGVVVNLYMGYIGDEGKDGKEVAMGAIKTNKTNKTNRKGLI